VDRPIDRIPPPRRLIMVVDLRACAVIEIAAEPVPPIREPLNNPAVRPNRRGGCLSGKKPSA
jgi:hypothetical protein